MDEQEKTDSTSIPEDVLAEFTAHFKPCPKGEEPDERFTTTELHQLFDEHLSNVFEDEVVEALTLLGFTRSLDTARMQFVWNMRIVTR